MEDEISNIKKYVSKSNIEVLKCYKYIFKYFTKSYGGFIVSGLFFLCFSFTNAFFYSGFSKIKIYIFDLLQNYISTIFNSFSNNIMNPPRNIRQSQGDENGRKRGKTEIGKRGKLEVNQRKKTEIDKKRKIGNEKKRTISTRKSSKKAHNNYLSDKTIIPYDETDKNLDQNIHRIDKKRSSSKKIKTQINELDLDLESSNNSNSNTGKEKEYFKKEKEKKEYFYEFFESYLSPSIEEMKYYDALKYDKRNFCEIFFALITDNILIINTFCSSDPLKPLTVKIVIYLIYINLFFVINGLFYDENYISKIYHSEEETFFSFVPRSIERFFYTSSVSLIIRFIIQCFFVEEKKIKRIF